MLSLSLAAVGLGVSAGLLQLAGYLFYVNKINLGRIRPNTASWSIWAFGALLDTGSYIFVTGDWVKNILPIVCAISALGVFFYCLRFGHFKRITRFEWFIVFLDCVAIFIWWWYASAIYANLFLVATAVISFIPVFLDVWRDPMTEDAKPWCFWTAGYSLLALVVILRWEKWEDLIYPLVFAILHVIVAVLAIDRRIPKTLTFRKSEKFS